MPTAKAMHRPDKYLILRYNLKRAFPGNFAIPEKRGITPHPVENNASIIL
jgi:hypothetical protein